MFNKSVAIAKNTLQEYFAYQVNFISWRLQVLTSFLIFYFLWYTLSADHSHIGTYSRTAIFTYFMIGYILRALVFSTRTADLAGYITSGQLSTLLLKPQSTISFLAGRDVTDKLFNLGFMVFEFTGLVLILRPSLSFPGPSLALLFALSLVLAIVLFFVYSLVISTFAFWTDQPWSSRWLFGIVFINIFSGQNIPLDLLPSPILRILNFTPYPYFYYYPLKLWLGELPAADIIRLFARLVIFTVATGLFALWLWRRGLKKYQAYGN